MTIQGIDLSGHQGDGVKCPFPDWPKVRAWRDPNGVPIEFAICKATEANGWNDPSFAHNWAGIESVDLVRGAYHYAQPEGQRAGDAEAEARHFASRLVGFRKGIDFAALDIEDARLISKGKPFVEWVRAFVSTLNDILGQLTVIYTGGPFFDQHDGDPDESDVAFLAAHPLWLAAYVKNPDYFLPPEWRKPGWWMHQYSGDAPKQGGVFPRIDGILTNCDRNVFRGTVADLRAQIAALVIPDTIRPPPNSPGYEYQGAATPLGAETFHQRRIDQGFEDNDEDTDPGTPKAKSSSISQQLRAVFIPPGNDDEPPSAA